MEILKEHLNRLADKAYWGSRECNINLLTLLILEQKKYPERSDDYKLFDERIANLLQRSFKDGAEGICLVVARLKLEQKKSKNDGGLNSLIGELIHKAYYSTGGNLPWICKRSGISEKDAQDMINIYKENTQPVPTAK